MEWEINDKYKNLLITLKENEPKLFVELSDRLFGMNAKDRDLFLQGFALAFSEGVREKTKTEELLNAVHSIPTKYTDKILLQLYKNGQCYHGDLAKAAEINLKDSGLTAIIKKISACPIPLIAITKRGKYKLYSLTKAGEQYVKENIITDSKIPIKLESECVTDPPEGSEVKITKEEKLQEDIYQALSCEEMRNIDLRVEQNMESKVRNV